MWVKTRKLLGLEFLKKERFKLDLVDDVHEHKSEGWRIPMVLKLVHVFIEWPLGIILFTRSELRKLHLSFFNASAQKLYELVKRARPEDISSDTKVVLEEISKACEACRRYSSMPYIFRVAMPIGEIVFNQEVAMDLMWIDGKAILHVVDAQTNYQNAVLLKGQSTEQVWDAFVEAWSTVYVGYPNKIKVDQGSVFTSKKWEELSSSHGIEVQLSGIESHNSIGVGERYHGPLRKIFSILRHDNPREDPEIILRYAVKGINDTMGENGIVPTTLVSGCSPSFPFLNSKLPKQRDRMRMLMVARREMATIIAERRITRAVSSK